MANQLAVLAQRVGGKVLAQRRWVVVLMLAALHLSMLADPAAASSRAFMLAHLGFFLLWQPLVSSDRSVKPVTLILLLAVGGAVLFAFTSWTLVLWIAGLIGLLGGRGFSAQLPRLRMFYLLAFLYLFLLLLLWAVPEQLAKVDVGEVIKYVSYYGLPLLLVAMAIVPLDQEEEETQRAIDFFYSLLSFQLALLIALGSLAVMQNTRQSYLIAVTITIAATAILLLVLALLWNPFAGFPGLKTYFSRYLLSVGMPFESWLRQLAQSADRELEAGTFLEQAMKQVAGLPSVLGGEWFSVEGEGKFGNTSSNLAKFSFHDLRLTLYTQNNLSPAVLLHVRLLVQLLAEFYEAKRREQVRKQNAYMQAVHETGARLTHDVKNLLQSLMSLSAAGQLMADDQSDAFALMVQRQLPQLTKRLQLTLERLQKPSEPMTQVMQPLQEWWLSLKTRYDGRDVEFSADRVSAEPIPRNLFDSVAENLLDNAIRKRKNEWGIKIAVRVSCRPEIRFRVADTGSPVPETIAKFLFSRPVTGNQGMGIGLLQAARQAESVGYRLALTSNEQGDVCFELVALDTAVIEQQVGSVPLAANDSV